MFSLSILMTVYGVVLMTISEELRALRNLVIWSRSQSQEVASQDLSRADHLGSKSHFLSSLPACTWELKMGANY